MKIPSSIRPDLFRNFRGRTLAFTTTIVTALAMLHSADAATKTWSGLDGGEWNVGSNWTPSAPVAADLAFFNSALTSVTNAVADQSLTSISFDTNAGADSGAFTIGNSAGNKFLLTSGGTIQLLSTLTGTGKTFALNSPIVIGSGGGGQSYTFANNNATASNILTFGGQISGGSTGATSLALGGTNTGANAITGNIVNGAGTVSVNHNGAGTWTLSGSNSYSGNTTLSASGTQTLILAGSNSGGGGTNISNGLAILQLNSSSNGGLASGTISLTNGSGNVIIQALNADRSLTNDLRLDGKMAFSGSQSISFTSGALTSVGTIGTPRDMANNIASGKLLTLNNIFLSPTIGGAAGSFIIGGSGDTTIAGVISNDPSGTGGTASNLTISNSGITTLSGTNTYSGATSLSNGKFVLGNKAAFGTSTVAMNGITVSAITNLSGSNAIANNVSIGGNNTFTGFNSLQFSGAQTLTGSRVLTNNIVGGTLTLSNTITNSAASTLALAGSGDTIVSGVIQNGTGSTALTYGGAGTLTLGNANTYTGATTVNSGRVIVDYANQGTGTVNNYVLNPATAVNLGGGTLEFKGKAGAGNTTTQTIGAITTTANTGLSTIVLNKNGGDALTVTAGLLTRNLGAPLLIDQSSGGVLKAANAGSATTALNSQIYIKDSTGRYDFATNTGAGTAFQALGDANQTALPTTGGSGAAANWKLLGSQTQTASTTTTAAQTNTLRIAPSGTGQFLDLNGFNLSATVLFDGGTYDYEIKDSLGTASRGLTNITDGNAGLALAHFGTGKLTISTKYAAGAGSSSVAGNGSNLIDLSGAANATGALTFSQVTLRISGANTLVLTNAASGVGSGQVVMGEGAIMEIASGNLTRNLAATGGANGTISMAGSSVGFSASGTDRTVNLASGGALTWGSTAGFLGNSATLILGSGFNDSKVDFQNAINLGALTRTVESRNGTAAIDGQLSGTISGSGGLNKTGAGALVLSGSNTYTGETVVSAGTLLINGNQSGATGKVTVNAGAILGGSGTIGGSTTIADNGTLTPGNSPGLLTFTGSLTLAGTDTKTTFEISGTNRGTNLDAVNVGGLLTYNGDLTLTMTGLINDGTYNLFDFGSQTGSFDTIAFGGVGNPYTGSFVNSGGVWTGISAGQSFTFTQSTGDLVVSAVPEPGTCALVGLAGMLLVIKRRRSSGSA